MVTTIAAQDPQPQLDQIGVARIDLKACAQAMHRCWPQAAGVGDSAGGGAGDGGAGLLVFAGADEVQQKDALPAVVEAEVLERVAMVFLVIWAAGSALQTIR